MVWFTVLGVFSVILSYVILTRRTTKLSPSSPPESSKRTSLSIEQARLIVDELVVKGQYLVAEPAEQGVSPPAHVGLLTKEFFSTYRSIRTRNGGFRLTAADVRPSEYVRGYVSIGHSEDWDVVQKPGNDEVFVVEGSETSEVEMEVRFQSVYHLVIDEAEKS